VLIQGRLKKKRAVTIGHTNKTDKVNGLRTIFVKEMEERKERGFRIEWVNKRHRRGLEKKRKEIKVCTCIRDYTVNSEQTLYECYNNRGGSQV
jgi:hypothetical protein